MTTTTQHQERMLCDKEEELVHVLSGKDPMEIADNLYSKCVLSDTMWDLFTSLDHSRVKPQLQIRKLVGRMDGDGDGQVNKAELEVWLIRVENNSHRKEAAAMFDKEDRNKDGFITFNEYWLNEEDDDAPIHKEDNDEETNPTYAKFMTADANHDGRLDLDEFVPFIHPFRHDHMIVHLINDQLTMYDYNKDGKISLDEFLKSFLQDGEEFDEMPEWLLEEKRDFEKHLDKDGDKILNTEEIREWVAPSEGKFREEEVSHLFKHADLNQDGYLSVREIREELDIFINSPATDYGYTIHDEL